MEISTQKLIMHGHNIALSSNSKRSLIDVGLIENEKLMLVGSSAQVHLSISTSNFKGDRICKE